MSFSKADIEKVIQMVNDGDVEALKAQEYEQFQYQGFDPLKIVESLMKVKSAKTLSDEAFKKDIFKMIAVGIIKGSVNKDNIKKMSDAGQTDLTDLIATYNVKMGGGKGQPAGVITFPRVMATFPDIAVRLVAVIGPKEFRGGPFKSSRLPEFMKIQVFPAVLPKDLDLDVKRTFLAASVCYSVDQSIQIGQIEKPDVAKLASDQSNFTNIGFNSPVPSDDVRRKTFDKLAVESEYWKIMEVLIDYKSKVDPTFVILTADQFSTKLKLKAT